MKKPIPAALAMHQLKKKPAVTVAAAPKAVPMQTAPAAAKAVPFSHPPAAFPLDAAHSGNMGKRSK